MKNGNRKISPEAHARLDEIVRIGNNAIRKAREENSRLGLPNVSERDGQTILEMPDGSIVIPTKHRENPEKRTPEAA